MTMAKSNGRLTAKSVGLWFSAKPYDEQAALLGELREINDKVREVRIGSLRRQLAELEGVSSNGHMAPKAAKRGPTKGNVKVKYRDPKTGDTWSGRGRMARWLAARVKAGEKQDKYLA